MDVEPIYKTKDWQSYLGVSRCTIWRYIQKGEIPKPDFYIGNSPAWTGKTRKRWKKLKKKSKLIGNVS